MTIKTVLVSVHDMILPNMGGGAPRTTSVANALSKRANTLAFVPVGKDLGSAEKELGFKILPLRYIHRKDRYKLFKHILRAPLLVLKYMQLILKYKIDLLFVHDNLCGFPALLAAKLCHKKLVLDMTDLLADYRDKMNKSTVLSCLGKLIEKYTIKHADRIITVSEAMKKILESYGAKDVCVVYDGVDSKVFYPHTRRAKKSKDIVFIYQGGMDPQDGLEILVPAAKILARNKLQFKIWLVGDGKMSPMLKKEIEENNLENYFWFSGWVPYESVAQYISDADVGLVILPDVRSAQIRVTLKTFEYWACKKPIIVAGLAALKEIVAEGTGIFYEADNAKDLADKMRLLCEDAELRRKLATNGHTNVRGYEWSLLGERIAELALE